MAGQAYSGLRCSRFLLRSSFAHFRTGRLRLHAAGQRKPFCSAQSARRNAVCADRCNDDKIIKICGTHRTSVIVQTSSDGSPCRKDFHKCQPKRHVCLCASCRQADGLSNRHRPVYRPEFLVFPPLNYTKYQFSIVMEFFTGREKMRGAPMPGPYAGTDLVQTRQIGRPELLCPTYPAISFASPLHAAGDPRRTGVHKIIFL